MLAVPAQRQAAILHYRNTPSTMGPRRPRERVNTLPQSHIDQGKGTGSAEASLIEILHGEYKHATSPPRLKFMVEREIEYWL